VDWIHPRGSGPEGQRKLLWPRRPDTVRRNQRFPGGRPPRATSGWERITAPP